MVRARALFFGLVLSLALAGRAPGAAADVDLAVIPYGDAHVPRQAYLRREKPVVRIRVTSHWPQWVGGEGRLSLLSGEQVLRTVMFVARVPAGTSTEIAVPFPLGEYRAGEYRLTARLPTGGGEATASAPIWVCPDPDMDGLTMSVWWERPAADAASVDAYLQRLRANGLSGVTVMSAAPGFLDRCLWNQVPCATILHGNAAAAGFSAPPESLYRLNASDKPSPIPWQPALGDQKIAGLANTDWQLATAHNLGTQVAALAKFPAWQQRVLTDDDYYTRTGPDYNPWNLRRYRQMHGAAAPRPPELLLPVTPRVLSGPSGVIPDNEPWVQWMGFLARDVLGHFNRLLTGEVVAATGGKGKIGPISGPKFTPFVDVASAQWPPFNFEDTGFNLTCSYNYNFYQVPALTQVWWQELGRMSNRDSETWLMPDCMDRRELYHLQNWYLALASGVDGFCYFIDERRSEAATRAFERLGPLARRYGKLLTRLRPAPRRVGLLMPFEQACYDVDYPANSGYAFDNLAMAHIEAEPVWPEELPEVQSGYRAVVLQGVTRLTQGNMALLRAFQRRGGVVIADKETTVPLPGAGVRKLDFALAGHDRQNSYDDAERIAQVRAALEPLAPPWADSDDRHLLLRHFQAGDVDYLWVVHVMNHAEDLAHQLKDPTAPIPPQVDENSDAGLEAKVYSGTISVPAPPPASGIAPGIIPGIVARFIPGFATAAGKAPTPQWAVYDVFNARKIETRVNGGRLEVPVRMGWWQGQLLAFYHAAPDVMELRAPHIIDAGKSADVRVWITAGGHYPAGYLPLEVLVTGPDGQVNAEYSRTALAWRGQYRFYINLARNDAPGIWRVTVKELSTGLTQSAEIHVRAGL